MARYELRFLPSVARDLRGIPTAQIKRILERVEKLQDDPRPHSAKKLAGKDQYRIRQGDHRILYTVNDVRIVVEVIKVGHRSDVYRK